MGARDDTTRVAEEQAADRIRRSGLRVTSARLLVLRALRESEKPLSAAQVYASVKGQGGHIDMVSVYRSLSILASLDLVHHVGSVDGFVACRMSGEHPESIGHLLCNTCGAAEEKEIPAELLAGIVAEAGSEGFSTETVRIEVMGQCQNCRPHPPTPSPLR